MFKLKHQSLSAIFLKASALKSSKIDDMFELEKDRPSSVYPCVWLDDDDGLQLPIAIEASGDEREEVFAEVATFYANNSPLSAYVHVVDKSIFDFEKGSRKNKTNKDEALTRHKLGLAVAMAVGEVLTSSIKNENLGETSEYSSYKSTMSFCIARSMILHRHYPSNKVADSWMRAKRFSGEALSRQFYAAILWANQLVLAEEVNISRGPLLIDELNEGFLSFLRGKISSESFSSNFVEIYPGIKSNLEQLAGPYDGRLAAFEKISSAIHEKSSSSDADAIGIAFYCNQIQPGTLAHFGLLRRHIAKFPLVIFWYCLFAGLSKEYDFNSVASGMGRKLSRDLLENFSFQQRPKCDVSIDELEVLSRALLKPSVIKSTYHGYLTVSLLPGVDVVVASSDRESEKSRLSESSYIKDILLRNSRIRDHLIGVLSLIDEDERKHRHESAEAKAYSKPKKYR